MVTWKEFAAAAPALAEAGRSLLNQFGVGLAFLATVRKDGAPRLHPVCPVLSNDRLFVLITPASPKRHDLVRDGRPFLHFHLLEGGRRRADVKGRTGWAQFDLPRPVSATRRRALLRELRARHGEK